MVHCGGLGQDRPSCRGNQSLQRLLFARPDVNIWGRFPSSCTPQHIICSTRNRESRTGGISAHSPSALHSVSHKQECQSVETMDVSPNILVASPQSTYVKALECLAEEIEGILHREPQRSKGCVRIEVPLSRGVSALQWLKSQTRRGTFSLYFSSKMSSAPNTDGSVLAESGFSDVFAIAGIGSAWGWTGVHGCSLQADVMSDIKDKTSDEYNRIKCYGGSRFDPGGHVGEEWESFGSFSFLIPRIEFVERGHGCVLACTIAWDEGYLSNKFSSVNITGYSSMEEAVADGLKHVSVMQGVSAPEASAVCSRETDLSLQHTPDIEGWNVLMETVQNKLRESQQQKDGNFVDDYSISPTTALDEYLRNGQKGLDDLLAASRSDSLVEKTTDATTNNNNSESHKGLVKLVLARRTNMILDEDICTCDLLASIQEKDPKAYQFLLGLPNGKTFLGCTPERLYARSGCHVVSEAVAGTRGRGPGGDIEKDFWLAFDLLQSQKDGLEFQLVRDSIMETFKKLCNTVDLEVEKSVLKQGSVQHLYGRVSGSLKPDVDDLDLVQELHPTPAVCGQPDEDAMCLLRSFESFDRGLYAGPFGWFSQNAADIAVAIRSSLVDSSKDKQTPVSLYAGVGIVPGSVTQSEWNELDLKISQFTKIFQNSTEGRIRASQNLSLLSAQIIVEELCRCGCNTFCVAPGSRSSPLTLAVAQHPRSRLVPGIDERSLAFWALGHGKATGRPCVVITSSGTAVANLLPAVVEASQSNVPLILLTADRPAELRDSGSNQTIDQVGIFGKYVRWDADLIPPSPDVPLRKSMSVISHAVNVSTSRSDSGPVHINCQFREPLHPVSIPWDKEKSLRGLGSWLTGKHPLSYGESNPIPSTVAVEKNILDALVACERGLIVVGEMFDPEDVSAAKHIGMLLGWPVAADVLSGLRVGNPQDDSIYMINTIDHILLKQEYWKELKPDVVLHLGSRITSKRLLSFLEWSALENQGNDGVTWILANRKQTRYDPAHLIDVRLECTIPDLLETLRRHGTYQGSEYTRIWSDANTIVENAIHNSIMEHYCMSEAHIARAISDYLPKGDGLFVGNSMPIRDLDMFCTPRESPLDEVFPGAPIAANRGASGIDGVVSSAAGYADGLQRKCTLVIGDVSFLHDTNGLNLLRTGGTSPALTVVVVNNSGGGIFDFLPISEDVPDEQFRPLWTTPQYVDIAGLCRAQGIPHMRVTSMGELKKSLESSWNLNRHCVLEVVTEIRSNVDHHELIKEHVSAELDKFLGLGTINMVRATRVSIPLNKQLTTASGQSHICRELIHITMDVSYLDGITKRVIGEIAPLPGLHAEDIDMAYQQVANLCDMLQGTRFKRNDTAMGLNERIQEFGNILHQMGLVDIYPSVRFGVEAALWEAVTRELPQSRESISVSALLNPHGISDAEIRHMATDIIRHGYKCIKVKAGRAEDPHADAEYLRIIRETVGDNVSLRVDCNQAWTLHQARKYAESVKDLKIEYIEEPLSNPLELSAWSKYSEIPIAVDESLDQGIFELTKSFCSIPKVVKYVVLKPSLIGGMAKTLALAQTATLYGITAVASSCFEGPIGLLHLAKISSLIDSDMIAHGISTESWFAQDFSSLTHAPTGFQGRLMPLHHTLGFAHTLDIRTGQHAITPTSSFVLDTRDISWNIVQMYPYIQGDILIDSHECSPIVLLHGMFGSSSEMQALAFELGSNNTRPIICVDLPAHGESRWNDVIGNNQCMLSTMAESLVSMLSHFKSCTLIGYSLGARLALLAALRHENTNIDTVVSISGGLGIRDPKERLARAEKDAATSSAFEMLDRQEFFQEWYLQSLWDSLRHQPGFDAYVESKVKTTSDFQNLMGRTLQDCSPGCTPYIRGDVVQHNTKPNIVLLAGEMDEKYKSLIKGVQNDTIENEYIETEIIQGVGHAMHLENAALVAHALQQYL